MYSKFSNPSTLNDIKNVPFADLSDLNVLEIEEYISQTKVNLINKASWIFPQLLALFNTFKLSKNDNGKYDPRPLAVDNFSTPYMKGIWKYLNLITRSKTVKGQNTPANANYSALVPIVLSSFKKFQNIPYSMWDADNLHFLIDKNLSEAMRYDYPELSKERMIEIRTQGITVKSGAREGQLEKPTAIWCLKGIKDTELAEAPKLATTMLAQIWVAHPSIRTEYMVLDPKNWDSTPELLVEEEILATKPKLKSFHSTNDMPF